MGIERDVAGLVEWYADNQVPGRADNDDLKMKIVRDISR